MIHDVIIVIVDPLLGQILLLQTPHLIIMTLLRMASSILFHPTIHLHNQILQIHSSVVAVRHLPFFRGEAPDHVVVAGVRLLAIMDSLMIDLLSTLKILNF